MAFDNIVDQFIDCRGRQWHAFGYQSLMEIVGSMLRHGMRWQFEVSFSRNISSISRSGMSFPSYCNLDVSNDETKSQ